MTNNAEMTNTELLARLEEAVTLSNRFFEERRWKLSQRWGERAEELYAESQRRSASLSPCGA